MLKKSLIIALLVGPLHLQPIAQNTNTRGLQPSKLWQINIIHCPKRSPSSFLHVSIDTNSSFIWATPLQGETTQDVITHLLACFAVMGTPSSNKNRQWPCLYF